MTIPKMRNVHKAQQRGQQDMPREDKQSATMFWLCIISGTLLAINTVVDIMSYDFDVISSLSQVVSVFTIAVFVGNSCMICEQKRKMFFLYFLLDNALLIFIFTMIARNSLLYRSFESFDSVHKTLLAINTFNYFIYVGNFRVMMEQCNWKKWKVISAKVSLLINALIYLITGTYIMIDQLDQISKHYGSTLAASIKDLIFFYSFGMFGLILELYGKISDKDGTGNYHYYYSFQKPRERDEKKLDEQMKELKKPEQPGKEEKQSERVKIEKKQQ